MYHYTLLDYQSHILYRYYLLLLPITDLVPVCSAHNTNSRHCTIVLCSTTSSRPCILCSALTTNGRCCTNALLLKLLPILAIAYMVPLHSALSTNCRHFTIIPRYTTLTTSSRPCTIILCSTTNRRPCTLCSAHTPDDDDVDSAALLQFTLAELAALSGDVTDARAAFVKRVYHSAVPLHVLMLLLLGLACLLPSGDEEFGCFLANNFERSLAVMIRYNDGSPPV